MKCLNDEETREHGEVVFKEGGFSIRVGHWNYFISHDACPKTRRNYCIAYDSYPSGEVLTRGACRECKSKYSKEMSGFISMLNWKR